MSASKERISGYREDIWGGLGEQKTHFAGESFNLHLGGGPVGEGGHSRQSGLLDRGREATVRKELGFRKKTQAI